jgi:dUTP pyrophosphatase
MLTLNVTPNSNIAHYYVNHSTAYSGDAGVDIFFPKDVTVPAKNRLIIDMEIVCSMECNNENISYYVYPRSSISKTPLIMANSVGVIDSGYTGNIKVAVYNTSEFDYQVSSGTRLFQICDACLRPLNVNVTDYIEPTDRNEGFGSSGV